jgi:hypothetical protein
MENFVARLMSLSARFARFKKMSGEHVTLLTLAVGSPVAGNLEKYIELIGTDVSFTVDKSKVIEIVSAKKLKEESEVKTESLVSDSKKRK